jgi:hypothetical protein
MGKKKKFPERTLKSSLKGMGSIIELRAGKMCVRKQEWSFGVTIDPERILEVS